MFTHPIKEQALEFNQEYRLWVPKGSDRMGAGAFKRSLASHAMGAKLLSGLVKGHSLCVQAGGNLGIFPNALSAYFGEVLTFEPHPVLFECLLANMRKPVAAMNVALGSHQTIATFHKLGKLNGTLIPCTGWHKFDISSCEVPQTTIDNMGLRACDAIVLDIERGEGGALMGAKETIAKFRPVIQVERDGGDALVKLPSVVEILTGFGYESHQKIGRDMIWLPCS